MPGFMNPQESYGTPLSEIYQNALRTKASLGQMEMQNMQLADAHREMARKQQIDAKWKEAKGDPKAFFANGGVALLSPEEAMSFKAKAQATLKRELEIGQTQEELAARGRVLTGLGQEKADVARAFGPEYALPKADKSGPFVVDRNLVDATGKVLFRGSQYNPKAIEIAAAGGDPEALALWQSMQGLEAKGKKEAEAAKAEGKRSADPLGWVPSSDRVLAQKLQEAHPDTPLTSTELQAEKDKRQSDKMEKASGLMKERQEALTRFRAPYNERLARIRAEAFGANRAYQAYDTVEERGVYLDPGTMRQANAKEPGRFVPLSSAEKAIKGQAIFGEMDVALENLRTAIDKYPKEEFSVKEMTQLSKAINATSVDEAKSLWGNVWDAAWVKSLDDPQLDLLVNIQNAQESVLGLRSIQGVGQGSESARAAMKRLVMSGMTRSKAQAYKQLDLLQAEVSSLKRGVFPGVPSPKKGAAPPPATTRVEPRKPGESIADYLKRTGAK